MISLSRGYASDVTAKAPWLLNGAKTLSYAISQSEHRLCDRRGIGDSIQYTTDGFTLECPNSSIVGSTAIRSLHPTRAIGILNGTSQRELFAWAVEEGKKVEYRKLPLAELREADHLFMTHGGWASRCASSTAGRTRWTRRRSRRSTTRCTPVAPTISP